MGDFRLDSCSLWMLWHSRQLIRAMQVYMMVDCGGRRLVTRLKEASLCSEAFTCCICTLIAE